MRSFAILLVLLPVAIFSQDAVQPKSGKFSIGLSYSPDYSYRILKANNLAFPDGLALSVAKMRDRHEEPIYGFTTGLHMAFQYSSKLSFETGLLFSIKGERKVDVYYKLTPGLEEPVKGSFTSHYLYLDIPLKAKYHITTGRTKVFVAAGVSPNIFLTSYDIFILLSSDGSIEQKTFRHDVSYNIVNIALLAGFGLSYNISPQMYFKLEPSYRRSITPIANAPVKQYLYSAGLDAGLFYRF